MPSVVTKSELERMQAEGAEIRRPAATKSQLTVIETEALRAMIGEAVSVQLASSLRPTVQQVARLLESTLAARDEEIAKAKAAVEVLRERLAQATAADPHAERLNAIAQPLEQLKSTLAAQSAAVATHQAAVEAMAAEMRVLATKPVELDGVLERIESIVQRAVESAQPAPPPPKRWHFDIEHDRQGAVRHVTATQETG